MTDPPRTPRSLIAGLLGPAGAELTCEQCFELLDVFVEAELSGGGVAAERRVPGMRQHLCGCPACSEEHQSLRDLIQTEWSVR
jgi:hypothetical protein